MSISNKIFLAMSTNTIQIGNDNYKIQDNCCKESYIGDYAVVNCQYYGQYDKIKSLKTTLYISYDNSSDVVLVLEKPDENKTAIGELQIPDSEKKSFKSHLISGWAKILYTCRISQNDEKAKINDRLRVTVWVKELKEKTEIKKTSKNKKEVETKP